MYLLLSILAICITVFFVIHSLQNKPITFVIHKKIEEIRPEPTPLSDEEKKTLEEQQQVNDGINEVIKLAQEFLGGDTDAEPEHKAK